MSTLERNSARERTYFLIISRIPIPASCARCNSERSTTWGRRKPGIIEVDDEPSRASRFLVEFLPHAFSARYQCNKVPQQLVTCLSRPTTPEPDPNDNCQVNLQTSFPKYGPRVGLDLRIQTSDSESTI